MKVIFENGQSQRYPKPLKLSELIPNHKSLSSPKSMALLVNGKVTSIRFIHWNRYNKTNNI